MSPILLLYALILALVVAGLWAAYRVLGTPTRLSRADYAIVLDDLEVSVARAADQLRAALATAEDPSALESVAATSRKIFQTGYYQALRLRPAQGHGEEAEARTAVAQACEAYDWASRMVVSETLANPAIRPAVRGLMDAGDALLARARRASAEPAPSPEKSRP